MCGVFVCGVCVGVSVCVGVVCVGVGMCVCGVFVCSVCVGVFFLLTFSMPHYK